MNPNIYAGLPDRKQKIYTMNLKVNEPHDIIDRVCDKLSISIIDIKSKSRKREFVIARQIAMVHIRKTNPKISLERIGKMFGGRHYSTVIYSENQYEELYQIDKEFTKAVNLVINN